MDCASCGHGNRERAAFCEACGSRLPRPCEGCGNELRPTASFCDACGRAVGGGRPAPGPERPARDAPRDYTPRHLADRILTHRGALEGERKHVTVLFADAAGYTSLAEGVDPEEVHALMDRCFRIILEQVHRFEGTVNQFTGDGVMALFGAPLALEDAPRRAVSAALAIQRALEPLDAEVRQRHGREFRLRMGIHSGTVVVGRIGDDLRMDYTAVGDTTNLAARLQQSAEPGQVLLSETTQHLVAGLFELRDRGATALRGKSEPVRTFEVRGELADRSRIEASAAATGLTPLVGRSGELVALREAFELARASRGQAVFVVGEAGIGKSRLVYEFRRSLEGVPHRWVEGRCTSYGRNTAFLPIADAVRRGNGIEDRDDDATAIAKLERGVAVAGEGLDWTLPFLRVLLSLPAGDERVASMDAVTRRSETSRALHALLLASTREEPLVLVIEDLHWVDPASEELLSFLTDAIPTGRALFVFTNRPGYRHPFGDRSYHMRLSLRPLSRPEVGAMAGALLASDRLPRPLADLIASKSDGNPFFVEEVTRSLVDDGVVQSRDGRVELARSLESVSVPDRIQDVLMARIDRLADEPKRAIQVASVIGREFALRLLERIVEGGEAVSSLVGELRSLELIYQKTAHPELAFMFKHALTHEVAYDSVLVQRRKALHQVVGRTIEELYSDRLAEHYEALAHHFSEAEDWERALEYHDRAADKAVRAYANQSAAEHLRRALEIGERIDAPAERRAGLEERLGGVSYQVADFTAGGQAYLRAAELSPPGARRALRKALAGMYFLWAHDYERARTLTDQALAESREHGDDDAATGMGLATRALQISVGSRFDEEVLELGSEGSRRARRSEHLEATTWACTTETIFLKHVGRFRESVERLEESLEVARSSNMTHAFHLWVLGLSLGGLGEYARVIDLFRNAIDTCRRVGQTALEARLHNSLGWLLAEIECHEPASHANLLCCELGEDLVKRELVPGAPELYANGKINLAGNLLVLGRTDEAEQQLEPVTEELSTPGDPWMRWRYAMHLSDARARVALVRGDTDHALVLLADEREAAVRNQAPKVEARALELRGRALLREGETDAAEEALEKALAVAREIGYPPVRWRALSLLAEVARRRGRAEEARRRVAEARKLVAGLSEGLDEDLRRRFLDLGERLESDPRLLPLSADPVYAGAVPLTITHPEIFGVTESSVTLCFAVEDGSGPVDAPARVLVDGEIRATSEGPGTRQVRVAGLAPATRYRVRIEVDGAEAPAPGPWFPGEIETLPPEPGAPVASFATMNDLHFGEPRFGGFIQPDGEYGEDREGYPFVTEKDTEVPYWRFMNDDAIDEINSEGVDAAIIKGDIADRGLPEQFEAASRSFARLRAPCHAFLGNHDHYGLEEGLEVDGYALLDQPRAPRVVELGGWRLVLLDTVDPGHHHGVFPDERRAWLESRLAEAPDRPTLLFTHHQPVPPDYAHTYPNTIGVRPEHSLPLFELVERSPQVRAVLIGHTHRNRVRRYGGGAPFVEVNCTKDYPGGWAHYRLYADGSFRQEVRRTASARALAHSTTCRDFFRGGYKVFSLGKLGDRSFAVGA